MSTDYREGMRFLWRDNERRPVQLEDFKARFGDESDRMIEEMRPYIDEYMLAVEKVLTMKKPMTDDC